jgi:hypothetical protein
MWNYGRRLKRPIGLRAGQSSITVLRSCLLSLIMGYGLIVIDRSCVSDNAAASWTRTVNDAGPGVVGVPEITPASNCRPAGSAPTGMLQVNGAVPPVTCTVWL